MSPQTSTRKLTLADIADVRAYERERDEFRRQVMETKRKRRLSFGTIITLIFIPTLYSVLYRVSYQGYVFNPKLLEE